MEEKLHWGGPNLYRSTKIRAVEVESPIRDYRVSDLKWLRPIAVKYNEWHDMKANLQFAIKAFVIPDKALMFFFIDMHGLTVAGCTDTDGIKEFIRLSRFCQSVSDRLSLPFHMHFEKGDIWQPKMAEKFGLRKEVGGIYSYTPSNK